MRILMLAQFYPPVIGGEERHVLSLGEALVARGHEVAVACMSHPDRPQLEWRNGVAIHSLHGGFQRMSALFSEIERPHVPPFPDPELAARLHGLARSFAPDVVHGHNWMIHSFLPVRSAHDAALVSTLHDYSLPCAIKTMVRDGGACEGPELRKCLSCAQHHFSAVKGPVVAAGHALFRPLHRGAPDRFIAVSRAVAETSGIIGGDIPFSVIPTFIPDDLAPPEDPHPLARALPPDGFLLFVGELNRNKGVDLLLDAYRRLENAPPLVLIGRRRPDTPDELPANVHIFEHWPHAAVMTAWSRCLFGVAPSRWVEPCGTIVMESNVVGKAMVAAGHGGLAELVEHGRNGLLFEPGDAAALAAAMQYLLDHPDFRRQIEGAALVAAEAFKANRVVPKIERIYREAIAGLPLSRSAFPADAPPQTF